MPAGADEGQQVSRADAGAFGVDQRVEVDLVGIHQAGVDHDRHQTFPIIQQGQRRQRPGGDPEYVVHPVGRGKSELARATDALVLGLEDHGLVFVRHDQKKPPPFVLQQQVLRECTVHVSTERLPFLNR